MAKQQAKNDARRSRLWLWIAIGVAVAAGAFYYFASVATQPSLVSGEGADLTSPQEVEAEVLDDGAAGSATETDQ